LYVSFKRTKNNLCWASKKTSSLQRKRFSNRQSNYLLCADCGKALWYVHYRKGYVCGNYYKHSKHVCVRKQAEKQLQSLQKRIEKLNEQKTGVIRLLASGTITETEYKEATESINQKSVTYKTN